MEVSHIHKLIAKLSNVDKPLTITQCKKLAQWLRDWLAIHDYELLQDVFVRVKGGDK